MTSEQLNLGIFFLKTYITNKKVLEHYRSNNPPTSVNLNLTEAVNFAVDVLNKLLDSNI
jgi:hypothetical protein